MLVASNSDRMEFHHASEYLGCNIGTARMITKIFREYFFVAVRGRQTRFDRYVRDGKLLIEAS
jgi:hypothetical protein